TSAGERLLWLCAWQGYGTRLFIQRPIGGRLEGNRVGQGLFRPRLLARLADDRVEGAHGWHEQLRRFLHQQRFLRPREAAPRQWPRGSDAPCVDILDARPVAPVLVEDAIGQGARGVEEDARLLPFEPLRAEVVRKSIHQRACAMR